MAQLRSLMTLVTMSLCAGDPGSPDGPCSLVVSGEHLMSYKATQPGCCVDVDIVNEGSGDCQLRMLLVGGGGNTGH